MIFPKILGKNKMAESEVESSEYYEDDDQEFENEVDLLTHQSVYNTLSDLFIERGYCQIKNDEKENLLIGKAFSFKQEIIDKICKKENVDLAKVNSIISELKKHIKPDTARTKQVDIDIYESLTKKMVGNSEYEKYKHVIKKILKNSSKKIYAFCKICNKLSTGEVQKYYSYMVKSEVTHGIIVCNIITPPVNNLLSEFKSQGIHIEFFLTDDIIFNITRHELVPRHEELTDEEMKELSKSINISKLPNISTGDPIFKFLGGKKGKVVKVYREDGNGMPMIAYRISS